MHRLKLFIAIAATATLVGVLALSLYKGGGATEPASIQHGPVPSEFKESDRAMVDSAWYEFDTRTLNQRNADFNFQEPVTAIRESHIRLTSGEFAAQPGCDTCSNIQPTMPMPMVQHIPAQQAVQHVPAQPMVLEPVYGAIPANPGKCN